MVKILLVEDNELNRDMLCRRLQRRGYEVVVAEDGLEGLAKASSEQPHLILMDMSLPELDGWEATKKLKADSYTFSIPIIALTAHAMTGDREKALAAGCNDYETKPVEIKRLLQKIETLLNSMVAPAVSKVANKQPTAITPPKTDTTITKELPIFSEDVSSTVTFPLDSPASTEEATPLRKTRQAARLLIVDDIEENRDMLSRRLQRKGYAVVNAASGEAALGIISRANLDLVLLDVMMPGIDGITTLKQIRQSYSQAQLPVIMVTAKDHSHEMVRAFELGANDYITKPVDLRIAIARIQALLKTLQTNRQEHKQVIHPSVKIYDEHATSVHSQPLTPTSQEFVNSDIVNSIGNHYQIIRLLKENHQNQTFVAKDIRKNELCLLNKIRFNFKDKNVLQEVYQLFESEITVLRQLSLLHRNQTPKILDFFAESRNLYLVQEFRKGIILSDYLDKNAPFEPLQVLDLVISILRVLKSFHYRKIIHTDLRPCNLLNSYDGKQQTIVLTDFGIINRVLMRLSHYFPHQNQKLFNPGGYIAPEQCTGQPFFSSDIYTVGMIALQAFTGKKPQELIIDPDTGELNWQPFIQLDQDLIRFLDGLVSQSHHKRYSSVNIAMKEALFRHHALGRK